MKKAAQIVFPYPVRLAIYGLIAIAVCQFVFSAVEFHGIAYAGQENGPVETAQVALALLASLCLFVSAQQALRGPAILLVAGCLVAYAAARECDQWFETVLFDDAYKYLAGIPLAAIAAVTLYRARRSLRHQLHDALATPPMTLFVVAGIYLCSVCQLLDRPGLWVAAGGAEVEMTKAAVEEFSELFGYLLLAFSGVEAVVFSLSVQPATVHRPAYATAAR